MTLKRLELKLKYMSMRVLCIDDKKKPGQIPQSQWVEEGVVYTVTKAIHLPLQPGIAGFLLKEVSLSPDCFPYEFYSSSRFVVIADKIEEKEEVSELVEEELSL
jgi:hypothetical protein